MREKGWIIGIVIMVLSIVIMGVHTKGCVSTYYSYENDIGSYWDLADKSSTLNAKSDYIEKFIAALKKSKHSEFNAVIYKTPTVNFNNNIKALQTLSDRLKIVSKMDQTSFAYQTAIQQITGQEQGEAREMLDVFSGCYFLENYPVGWNWICGIIILGYCILFIVGLVMVIVYDYF